MTYKSPGEIFGLFAATGATLHVSTLSAWLLGGCDGPLETRVRAGTMIITMTLGRACGDEQLSTLLQCFRNIEVVSIGSECPVSGPSLARLLRLPKIRRLNLQEDDRDLSRVKVATEVHNLLEMKLDLCARAPVPFPTIAWGGLTNLRQLSLWADNPLDSLANLPLLEHLESDCCSIGFRCLCQLRGLTNLKFDLTYIDQESEVLLAHRQAAMVPFFCAISFLSNLQRLQLRADPDDLALQSMATLVNLTSLCFIPTAERLPVCTVDALRWLAALTKLQLFSCDFVEVQLIVSVQLPHQQGATYRLTVPLLPPGSGAHIFSLTDVSVRSFPASRPSVHNTVSF